MQTDVISYKSVNIRYSAQGKGDAIILLHGYLESLEIWNGFADELAKNYLVVSIDLPGHGKSGILGNDMTIDQMAECVNAVVFHLSICNAVVIGHSMGGYVALAFAKLWPENTAGVGLFHSITWADLPEKREARDKEIEFVKQGKKQLIFNVNIPKGFADDNLEKFKSEVDYAKSIASATTDEGIIAALNAMKNRKDRTNLLEKLEVPVFFGIGLKDNYIPSEKIFALTSLPDRKHVSVFENSGHMGFIEEREYAVDEIDNFMKMCYSN
jgi:pimeloyl-ACP methyl ester carboxylesterase